MKNEVLSLIDEVKLNQERLYNDLIGVIETKTGDRYSQEFIDKVQKEGSERFKNNIPPGYDDGNKTGVRRYNKMQYELKYGDLIIWKDLIEFAKSNQEIEHVILVTSDGKSKKKNDLLYKVDNQIVGPRIELLHEMQEYGAAAFYIIDELKFIEEFSEEPISTKLASSISDTLATLSKSLSQSSKDNMVKEFSKAAVKLNNSLVSKSKRREVTDIFELEEKLNQDYNIMDSLAEYVEDKLPNMDFEGEYFSGWGEFEGIHILSSSIDAYAFEDNFYEITCAATVNVKIEFNIVTKNPDFELGEEEFFYESSSCDLEFTIEFTYDIDYDMFENIAIIDCDFI